MTGVQTCALPIYVPLPITVGLRLRGVEVITAQKDGTARFPDPDLPRVSKLATRSKAGSRTAKSEFQEGIPFSSLAKFRIGDATAL